MNVNGATSVSGQTTNNNRQTEQSNTLGQDAFLRILVTQMKHQDPMEPLKDTEFIGQMAQFSSLEQLTNLNTTMNHFISLQGKPSIVDHAHLIGNTVHWEQIIEGQLQSGQGVVKALTMKNGELMVELESGNVKISTSSIYRIEKNLETNSELNLETNNENDVETKNKQEIV